MGNREKKIPKVSYRIVENTINGKKRTDFIEENEMKGKQDCVISGER
jgi:hypothetical protein